MSGWRERRGKLPPGHGLGMACSHYVSGSAKPVHWSGEPHAVVNLRLDFDGGITILTGAFIALVAERNGELAGAIADAGFIAVRYDRRGYGQSEGQPSEAGLLRDFMAASRFLSEAYGIAPDRQVALDVDAYLYPTELQGVLGMVATARAGIDPEAMEAGLDGTLAEVADGWIQEQEVQGAVMRARRDHLSALANVEERAEELAYATTVLGRPEALEEVLSAYASIDTEEIRAAAWRLMEGDTGATVTVVPLPGMAEEPEVES